MYSSVDSETDALIQEIVRTDFDSCTILCVAHRLQTILDYDRVAVLEAGRILEFDTPSALLGRDSRMRGMLVHGERCTEEDKD